ncbi:hypothetical protein MNBD_UNCLBAC01-513 [hydrothermal vent metagenome]|uniref:Uncharacterized protein n=1 Tax=hydrothermal vent metagenome TaxID=652676 RepID=A0A3B1D4Q9_9ZZZZ
MKKIIFETDLLPDGHLYCPPEFLGKKNLHFDVIVSFEEQEKKALDEDIERAALNDVSEDFLSKEELEYYFNLEEL